MVTLLTYASMDEFSPLCETLGQRLLQEGSPQSRFEQLRSAFNEKIPGVDLLPLRW
jgi:hypothetical protein